MQFFFKKLFTFFYLSYKTSSQFLYVKVFRIKVFTRWTIRIYVRDMFLEIWQKIFFNPATSSFKKQFKKYTLINYQRTFHNGTSKKESN